MRRNRRQDSSRRLAQSLYRGNIQRPRRAQAGRKAQLEGTENRITIARQRHIEAIKEFNDRVTVPPSSWTNNLLYHHKKMAQWALDDAEQKAVEKVPEVDF